MRMQIVTKLFMLAVAALGFAALAAEQAEAGSMFKFHGSVPAGTEYFVGWDFNDKDGKRVSGQVSLDGAGGVVKDPGRLLRDAINAKTGDGDTKSPSASLDPKDKTGNTVLLKNGLTKPTMYSFAPNLDPPPGFVTIAAANGNGLPFLVDIGFESDPNTGIDVLVGPGSYAISGPGGLTDSFTAPTGASGDDLATLLAGVLSNDGYDAIADANHVLITTPGPGEFDFSPSGPGFDYSLNETDLVPEPSTLAVWLLLAAMFGVSALRGRPTA